MRPFKIMTDTDSDIPYGYAEEKGITLVPQYTLLDGVTYEGAEGIDPADFYNRMAAGSEPQSQAINPAVCEEKFRKQLDAGFDIIYLSFSSELSGSYGTAVMVGKQLEEEYPGSKIYVIDTLAASLGQTLMVMNAVAKKEAGEDIDTVAKWLEDTKQNLVSIFTVDTLKYLQRGGRISKTTQIVGTLAGIKPILAIDSEGKLGSAGKERGRKKSLSTLIDMMDAKLNDEWKQFNADTQIAIAHGNCIEDVERIKDMIKDRFGITKFVVNDINPSIGVHSGPGAIAIFFYGTER